MKIQELLCYVILIGLLLLFSMGRKDEKREIKVLHEVENVAVPEYYRHILGYDSLQVIFFMGKWEANFCYPNKWEQNKFKLDTIKN